MGTEMKVCEIFVSIEGEGPRAGHLSNFIRLSGCNLDCSYCDTVYAGEDENAREMTATQIIKELDSGVNRITLTGGEPFFGDKIEIINLLQALCDFEVSVETNGTAHFGEIHALFDRIPYIVDYKLPGSGMEKFMQTGNYLKLRAHDAVKFVVSSYKDLIRMTEVINKITADSEEIPEFYVSAAFGRIKLSEIAEFIRNKRLNNVRLQLQIHKYIWDPKTKGV